MTNTQLTGGVAVRVSALCLTPAGRVADWSICGPAVRGGLLLDLALAGRVEQTEDSVVVDETPTGFAPADRLLAAIAVEPERSLDGWLDERRIGLRDLVGANVASGRWVRHRPRFRPATYEDRAVERTTRDLTRSPAGPFVDWTPADACVTAILTAAGLLAGRAGGAAMPAEALLAAAGAATWLVLFKLFRVSSIGSLAGVAVSLVIAWLTASRYAVYGLAGVSALIVLRHQGNIRRLLARQEG